MLPPEAKSAILAQAREHSEMTEKLVGATRSPSPDMADRSPCPAGPWRRLHEKGRVRQVVSDGIRLARRDPV
jgi:hypothetical protein